jgi:hypothetical protein
VIRTAALRVFVSGLRANVKQAQMDLDRMTVTTADQHYHQGYQCGRIATMETIADTLDMCDQPDEAGAIVLGLTDWARAPELLIYARRRGIEPAEAVRQLVNCGLSHQ